MAITESLGYGGTITEDDLAVWRRAFPGTYGVVAAGDWKVTVKPGVDRTLRVAAGQGYGHLVVDTNDDTEAGATVQLNTLASGTRWDLIVARRDWSGSGGTSTFTKVTGTSVQTAVLASRAQTPGVLDEQPLALVQVTGNGGGGVISDVVDLRVWHGDGGAYAESVLVLQFLTDVGTMIRIGGDVWSRGLDPLTGSAAWTQIRLGLAKVPTAMAGSAPPAGTPLHRVVITNAVNSGPNGRWAVSYGYTFPNGVVAVSAIVLNGASTTASINLYGRPGLTACTLQLVSGSGVVPNAGVDYTVTVEGW